LSIGVAVHIPGYDHECSGLISMSLSGMDLGTEQVDPAWGA
jgi:hypothetical protein